MTDAGRAFGEQVGQFETRISGYEGAWGDDTIGGLIGTAYGVVSQWALECWREAADELASAGDDLAGMAKAYDSTESTAAEDIARLNVRLG